MAHRTLSGKSAVVTGASSGIGRALVVRLAAAGTNVVAIARREEKLRELSEELSRTKPPGRLEIVAGDVTEPAVREEIVRRAEAAFGGLDILVNNAGIGSFGRFADGEPQRLRRIFEVNFFAVVELTRAALPALQKGKQPIVVNVGSILGHTAIPRMHEYCSTKFALRAFSDSLRCELSPQKIDVLLVSPGTTETDFYDQVIHGRGDVPWPKGRGVTSDAVARATIRAIERGKREIIPSLPGRLLVWASSRAPRIVDRFLNRYA